MLMLMLMLMLTVVDISKTTAFRGLTFKLPRKSFESRPGRAPHFLPVPNCRPIRNVSKLLPPLLHRL